MPTPSDYGLNYLENRQSANLLRQQMLMKMYQDEMMRRQMMALQQYYKLQAMRASPAWGRLQVTQGKYQQSQVEDQAWANYLLAKNPNNIDPIWRQQFREAQQAVRANPAAAGAIAKSFLTRYRPASMQLKVVKTVDADGMPMTYLAPFDPGAGGVPAAPPVAHVAGGGGTASAAAPATAGPSAADLAILARYKIKGPPPTGTGTTVIPSVMGP